MFEVVSVTRVFESVFIAKHPVTGALHHLLSECYFLLTVCMLAAHVYLVQDRLIALNEKNDFKQ